MITPDAPTIEPSTTAAAAEIGTNELHALLAQPDVTTIDVRPIAAFNGWRLRGEVRGGHVPGARAFPAAWLRSVDAAELERLLADKRIEPGRSVVVYGHDRHDAASMSAFLLARGIADVRVYADGWSGWAAREDLPVERAPGYHRLVHIDWLRSVLAGETPEAPPAGPVRLFHVNFGVPEEYAEGHIPGALYLDTNRLEDPADWNRRSPEELEAALLALGITAGTTVVVYGRDTEGDANEKWPGRRAGQIAATRAALILRYAGVNDVRLLDGGYDWWVQAGQALESEIRRPEPVASFGARIPLRPDLIVDIDEARAIIANPDGAALVSVRTWREHIGAVSGYNYIGPAGRIRGDVWGNCGTDAYHMQHYRNVDNTMRAYPEIAASWASAGITPDKHVAFYCGTGWRASETWFYAWVQGWERISVYDGGWFEWSQDPERNPIDIGEPDAAEAEGAAA